jgi:hypothetical protein
MKIAFNNLKQEKRFWQSSLEIEDDELLNQGNICNGLSTKSKDLYPEYINNKLSEYTIKGALYNLNLNLRMKVGANAHCNQGNQTMGNHKLFQNR